MFDTDLLVEVTQVQASLARIAAAIDTGMSGPVADELLTELLAAGRQVDLGMCRAVERVERTGQSCADGVASTAAFVRRRINERGEWASKRVAVGRALAGRLPMAAKGWEVGHLGLEHASVIDHATRQLEDPALVAEVENLDLLCAHHHHLLHEGGWRLTIDNDTHRTPWFHPPRGGTALKGQRRPLIPMPRRT